jgi:hypothetical protein
MSALNHIHRIVILPTFIFLIILKSLLSRPYSVLPLRWAYANT